MSIFLGAPRSLPTRSDRAYTQGMSIISLVVFLVVIGVALWLVNTMIPMDQKIKTLLNVVVILAVCLWLLRVFGLFHGGPVLRFR